MFFVCFEYCDCVGCWFVGGFENWCGVGFVGVCYLFVVWYFDVEFGVGGV